MSMNSTEKGDAFERRVYAWIRDEVAAGRTAINANGAQFFHKRPYFSPKREEYITFDIAVEFRIPIDVRKALAFLWLIECKNLGRPVGIEDIEEFCSKVRQVEEAEFQVKATVFSASGFTKSALTFARNSGVSLARLDTSVGTWILPRLATDAVAIESATSARTRALVDPDHHESDGPCYGVANASWCSGLGALLRALLSEAVQSRVLQDLAAPGSDAGLVPFLSLQAIEDRVEASIARLRKRGLTARTLDAICASLTEASVQFDFDTDLGTDARGRPILGRTTLDPIRVSVSCTITKQTPRWRFTLAHELGHLALHRQLHVPEVRSHVQVEGSAFRPGLTAFERLEYQANQFASALLMPRARVREIVEAHMLDRGLRPRGSWAIYVDDQACNRDPFYDLLRALEAEFDVSSMAAELRLKSMGLLKDDRAGPVRGGDVLRHVLRSRS